MSESDGELARLLEAMQPNAIILELKYLPCQGRWFCYWAGSGNSNASGATPLEAARACWERGK